MLTGVTEVEPAAWDALLGPEDSPFHEHAFLAACERASAVPEEGAQAQHLTLWEGERLVAALPLYLKGDGRGEFIYDYHWWELAARNGLRYYPKAVAMSPYTPVAGARLLADPGLSRPALWRALAEVLEAFGRELELGGVHLLFCSDEEASALEEAGWLRRLSYQPRWEDQGYGDLEGFLARFNHKHRVVAKRERRKLSEQGLEVTALTGEELGPAEWAAMHGFYERTCAAYGTGSDYLKPGTWDALFEGWRARLVLFLARRDGEPVGGSLCVHKGEELYGRYWGSREELDCLYFNLAFHEPIAWALARGVRRFYAGFGNSRAKYGRGLLPCATHSVHRLFDPALSRAIAAHLEEDRREVAAAMERERGRSRLKPAP
ncbi:MAG: GNAT family N-acetyltransferase [Planctomycetota bacterium]